MKTVAVLLYPRCSLQEITALTSTLALWFDVKLDYLGSSAAGYDSEEGLRVLPGKTFGQAQIDDYDCLILPGTVDPLPALYDPEMISFLRQAKGKEILLAAISSAPLFLAKAGLLEDTNYTAGFFMQMTEVFPFLDTKHFIHQPVAEDKNVVTAIGFAFREFAKAVLARLGFDVGESFLAPAEDDYTQDELTFWWDEADYQEFLQELKQYDENKA